jgi:AmiR/NasT family two-component response regulator
MDRRAEEVAVIQRRALRDRTRLDQAVGILAQVCATSASQARTMLREHAEHHRFVLTELAADIVAGRVDPTVVTALPRSRDPRAQARIFHPTR